MPSSGKQVRFLFLDEMRQNFLRELTAVPRVGGVADGARQHVIAVHHLEARNFPATGRESLVVTNDTVADP